MDRTSKPATDAPLVAAAHDLAPEVAAKVEDLHARLDQFDHYELLGIPRTATRAQVRTAFVRVAPPFHPDRYFGKKLGALGPKMQRVFAQLSLAHDTLISDELRAEYDAELPAERPVERPVPPVSGQTRVASSAAPAAPAPAPPAKPSGAMRRESISVSLEGVERARREALAARLQGRPSSGQIRAVTPAPNRTPMPARMTPAGTPAGPPSEQARAAAESLRRRYEQQLTHAKGRHVTTHADAAKAAESRGDLDEAANQYRQALEQTANPTIKAAYDDVLWRAKEAAVDKALGAGRDFEMQQGWAEAAAAFAKAYALKPSAETAYRAANALRRVGGDMRRAAHFGEEAVKLEPNKLAYRIALALIYGEAGLPLRARGELERAKGLDPNSPLIREVMAKLKLR